MWVVGWGGGCVASVSSALLPHVAAEKKGASRGSHSGEGRVNRPLSTPPSPPQAWSLAPSFPEQDKEELYRLSGNTGKTFTIPVLWALETEAEDHHGLFILLTGLNAPFQKTQLSISPGLSPAEAVHGGLKEKKPIWISSIWFFHTSRINLHLDNMLLLLCLYGSSLSLWYPLCRLNLQDRILNIRFTRLGQCLCEHPRSCVLYLKNLMCCVDRKGIRFRPKVLSQGRFSLYVQLKKRLDRIWRKAGKRDVTRLRGNVSEMCSPRGISENLLFSCNLGYWRKKYKSQVTG